MIIIYFLFFRYGQTALHAIARDWHVDVVKYVLGKGAIINKQDLYGRTPLHLASAVDYHEMVEFLVLNGGKPAFLPHP